MGLMVASLCALGCKSKSVEKAPVRVAAAADLSAAFEELGKTFEQKSGQKVLFTFGSTGQLTQQVKEGAPFDVLAAANVAFVDQAVAAGACDGSTKALYGRGRIVVWTKQGGVAPVGYATKAAPDAAAPEKLARLEELADPRFVKIAIANPEHAPYGQAAREALKAVGIWDELQPRLVFGENVRQTLQLAQTGNAEVAIVALSLVVADKTNPWGLIDGALHPPLDQAMVICNHGANVEGAKAFAALVGSPEGRALMSRYGFTLPEKR